MSDADTHREEYLVKPVKGGPVFAKRSDVRIVNQCNDLLLEVAKPVSLLVPTAKSLTDPVTAPEPVHHNLEHFLCYQAKAQAKLADGTELPKFPKGIQVEVADQFQTRRYDLVKITKLCNPVDKAGTPTLLAGPNKGDAKPITPATRVARRAPGLLPGALATKAIAQRAAARRPRATRARDRPRADEAHAGHRALRREPVRRRASRHGAGRSSASRRRWIELTGRGRVRA